MLLDYIIFSFVGIYIDILNKLGILLFFYINILESLFVICLNLRNGIFIKYFNYIVILLY